MVFLYLPTNFKYLKATIFLLVFFSFFSEYNEQETFVYPTNMCMMFFLEA